MTRTEPQLLSERAQSVLRDVVDFYIRSAEPVSSAEIAKRRSLSSATVRNVMADLDQGGFLRQPHTSAGRIPTADGYHVYIDSLMRRRNLSSGVRTRIGEALNGGRGCRGPRRGRQSPAVGPARTSSAPSLFRSAAT